VRVYAEKVANYNKAAVAACNKSGTTTTHTKGTVAVSTT
jgi:hypothetical protein